jgi:transposase
MTPESEAARKQASEDLVDIAALRQSTPFTRYWVRRLKSKRASLAKSFEDDPPAKVDAAEREILRRMIKFCDELERMPAQDAASAETLLRQ